MRRINKKNTVKLSRFKPIVSIFVVITLVFMVVIVFLSIHTAAAGAEVAYLEKEEEELIIKTKQLSDRLENYSSLRNASEKADELGFTDPQKIIYASKEETAAKLP